jgi:hypothetical protein
MPARAAAAAPGRLGKAAPARASGRCRPLPKFRSVVEPEAPIRSRVDVLALSSAPQTLTALRRALLEAGFRWTRAATLADAQAAFLAMGGQDGLIIAPDASPSVAEQVVLSLRRLDPRLPVLVFGRDLLRGCTALGRVHRLPEYHPASRAGVGAVLKWARGG